MQATKGPEGGYRLDAGTELPPLLFDDEQAVAVAVALQTATSTVTGIGEGSARALATVRQVMPARLRHRVDALQVTAVDRAGGRRMPSVDTEVLLALGTAVRAREVLRFDYEAASGQGARDAAERGWAAPRRVEPHHLVTWGGRWYLVAFDLDRSDWRTFRVDRVRPRTPTGPRFTPRALPEGDVSAFVAARFERSSAEQWPCRGEVLLDAPAELVSGGCRATRWWSRSARSAAGSCSARGRGPAWPPRPPCSTSTSRWSARPSCARPAPPCRSGTPAPPPAERHLRLRRRPTSREV